MKGELGACGLIGAEKRLFMFGKGIQGCGSSLNGVCGFIVGEGRRGTGGT